MLAELAARQQCGVEPELAEMCAARMREETLRLHARRLELLHDAFVRIPSVGASGQFQFDVVVAPDRLHRASRSYVDGRVR